MYLFSPALSHSTFFLPQACKETLPLPAVLIPLASPVLLNILKASEDSGYSYVPSEGPAKSPSVPGLLSGDPSGFSLLLLAFGQPSPARGLTGNACSGCSGWNEGSP